VPSAVAADMTRITMPERVEEFKNSKHGIVAGQNGTMVSLVRHEGRSKS